MSACCLILSAVRRFNCCKSPGEQYINLWYTCGFLGSLPYLMRTARFLFVMMNWGGIRPAVSSQLRCAWIWMRVLRCQCECVSICKYIMPNKREFVSGSSHQVYEQLVTFHGQDNVLLWVFQRFYLLRVCRTCF